MSLSKSFPLQDILNRATWGETMQDFLEIKSMEKKDQEKIFKEIQKAVELKKKEGVVTEKEIREIEEMTLRLFPDIQDVQSVYEDFLFQKKDF